MYNLKKLTTISALFTLMLSGTFVCASNNCPNTCQTPKCPEKVESYAHPTLFNGTVQQTTDGKRIYVVGSNEISSKNKIGIKNKCGVYASSWSKNVLTIIEKTAKYVNFDVKKPVLRSELAVILAEGFDLTNADSTRYIYKDISKDYWAKGWIYKALNSGLMIGYPDGNFRPDQPVTKAEVFAVIAKIVNVPTDRSLIVPTYNNKTINFIPRWAIPATKEVVASEILCGLPEQNKINSSEYLSKEQVANVIGALRYQMFTGNSLKVDKKYNATSYAPVCIDIQMKDRIDAKHSNVGDKFKAKTLSQVCVNNKTFNQDSIVTGEVIQVKRPGVKHPGYIKVKFIKIECDGLCEYFPEKLSSAEACKIKNPNFLARLLGAPFSGAGRIVGVAGRSASSILNIAGNGLEQYGDQLSDTFVETFSLEPISGLRSFGSSFITLGKGIYDISKIVVSGVFGIIYEVGDEIVYLIVPSVSNESALNPGETLRIIF